MNEDELTENLVTPDVVTEPRELTENLVEPDVVTEPTELTERLHKVMKHLPAELLPLAQDLVSDKKRPRGRPRNIVLDAYELVSSKDTSRRSLKNMDYLKKVRDALEKEYPDTLTFFWPDERHIKKTVLYELGKMGEDIGRAAQEVHERMSRNPSMSSREAVDYIKNQRRTLLAWKRMKSF